MLGADHRDTLQANYDLASLSGIQKLWEEFDRLSRDTLARQRRVLGDKHPDTLRSLNNVQSSYYARGRYGEDLQLPSKSSSPTVVSLEKMSPEALTDLHNLATIYDKLGRYGEAEPLYLKAVDAKRRVLGGEHPQTARTLYSLAVDVYGTAAVRRGGVPSSRSVPDCKEAPVARTRRHCE